jgi:RNA-binding protein
MTTPDSKPLTDGQKQYLRALLQQRNALVLMGAKGLTDALVNELNQALDVHELVKVKLSFEDKAERAGVAATLAARTASELVQQIGNTAGLFRRNPTKPQIALPKK